MPNEIISNGKKYSGNYPTNLAENIVNFESEDESNPTSFQEMPPFAAPGRMKTLMRNLSIGYKNLRYLVKLFGTTDISAIGDGTVSGSLKQLNTNLSNFFVAEGSSADFDAKNAPTGVYSFSSNSNGTFPCTYGIIICLRRGAGFAQIAIDTVSNNVFSRILVNEALSSWKSL